MLPRDNLEAIGLEPLERNYGRFPSVDLSVRFAGVSNLGKPLCIERKPFTVQPIKRA